ncbi:MAG: dihydrolipoyl dehydrogenase [Parachlamydiaceae bacterium]
MMERYDLAVVGSGPGGYVSAIRAAQLGFKTVCIDKNQSLGGTCLNVGCIPSKTLLQATELLFYLQDQGEEQGFEWSDLRLNFSKLMERKKKVIRHLNEGIAALFRQHQISLIEGRAEFIDSNHLRITSQTGGVTDIEAAYTLIATGSEPIQLGDIPFDGRQVISSTEALNLPSVPDRMVIIGAGVIGVELASIYCRLGSQVQIIEMLDHICPTLDDALSKHLHKLLQKQGIQVFLSSKVLSAIVQPDEVILVADLNGELHNISANVVLVAVGRRSYTKGLQLDRIGVKTDRREGIVVDECFRTTQSNIFAVGDVIDGPMLAHRASVEGVAVVEFLKGRRPRVDYLSIPSVIYTYPEVAAVGLTQQDARQAGLDVMVGMSFFRGNPRARCSGEIEGFVKVIGDKCSGRLVGLHIIGSHASELISQAVVAMQLRAKVKDLADLPQAHPTLSETLKEAALNALEGI